MTPVEFPEMNVVYGKGQKEYLPLPARRTPGGEVISCWELTPQERAVVAITGRLWLRQYTFATALQPILMQVERPFPGKDRVSLKCGRERLN